MTARATVRTAASISLVVVARRDHRRPCGAGLALKAPCASGEWGDGRQYTHLCYSDIVPLFGTEHLQGGRLPYIDHCPADAGQQCDEYPVLTMWFMRVGGVDRTAATAQFFFANVAACWRPRR